MPICELCNDDGVVCFRCGEPLGRCQCPDLFLTGVACICPMGKAQDIAGQAVKEDSYDN